MKGKKRVKKRGKKNGKSKVPTLGGFFKSAVKRGGQVMVNKVPAKMHDVVAPHYLTKLAYGFTGYQLTTVGGLGAGLSYFTIALNSLTFPGNVAGIARFTDASFQGTLVPATLALNALNPMGYSQLGVLYQQYRVFASKITVVYNPNATLTSNMVCIYPQSNAGGFAAPEVLDMQRALNLPYAKFKEVTSQNMVKNNSISSYMDVATLNGLTKQQMIDDNNYASPSIPGSPPFFRSMEYTCTELWINVCRCFYDLRRRY